MTEATTHTIDAPAALLTYDIRPGSDADKTPLVMVASPMAAAGFTTLAGHFTDRGLRKIGMKIHAKDGPVLPAWKVKFCGSNWLPRRRA